MSQQQEQINKDADEKLRKAKDYDQTIWRETHPEEYKKQQEDEKMHEQTMKQNMKGLKKEVNHTIKKFIKRAKTLKKQTHEREKLLKRLKSKFEQV